MNLTGGQARIAASLFKGLGKRFNTYYLGYETEYLKGGVRGRAIFLNRGEMLGTNLKKSRMSESAFARLGYNFLVTRNLLNLGIDKDELVKKVKGIKPNVIIANSIGDLALLMFLRKRGVVFKSIYIDHGSASGTVKNFFSKESIPLVIGSGVTALSTRQALRKFFGFFDMNVALSIKQMNDLSRFTNKVTYIPNGITAAKTKDDRIKAGVRARYKIKKGDFVVLYLGRLFERQKNVSTLIQAFAGTDRKDMKLLIVGEGPSMNDYRQLAAGDSRIVFAGRVEDSLVPYMYGISDLYVLPSNWEGFSLTLLEAATNSLPIIISRSIDSEEYKVDGKSLPTFETNDSEDLERKIMLVYNNKSVRKGLAAVSHALSKKYSEDKMLKAYTKLILKLANTKW